MDQILHELSIYNGFYYNCNSFFFFRFILCDGGNYYLDGIFVMFTD